MLFLIYRKDKPGHLQVRLDNHQKHIEHLALYGERSGSVARLSASIQSRAKRR